MSFLILVGKENIKIGELERKILEFLVKKEDTSVINLYSLLCFHELHKKEDRDLYNSVCRAVRSLENKGLVSTRKVPYNDLDPEYYRFNLLGAEPTYVKIVFLNYEMASNYI